MSSFTATTVCCSFVKQYYEGLLWNPKSLPACYGPDSSLTSNEADHWDQPASTVTGSEITQALEGLSQALKQKQLRILGAEAIPSFEDSILIIVRGVILSRDCAQRYNHTFLLRQNGVEGEFYIRNDVWLYNEKEPLATDEVRHEEPAPMAESTISAALGEPLPPAAHSVTNSPARKTPSESSRRATPATSALIPEKCPPSQPAQPAAEEHVERSATPEAAEHAEVTPPSQSTPAASTGAARAKDSPAAHSSAAPSSNATPSSGPRNWATLVKSAPSTSPASAAEKPQRVSPKPQPVPKEKEDPKLGASGSGAGGSQKGLKDSRKREEPKCRVTMKIRSGAATDEAIKAALPPALVPHLLSLRNLSAAKFVVFMDFSDPNALATLQEARVSVAGNPVLFELQKPRE